MPMTENDLADLDKLFRRMEKNAKAWTVGRWIEVVFGLLFLGGGAWLLVEQPVFLPALLPRDFSKPVDTLSLMLAQGSAISYCLVWAACMIQLYFGSTLLISSLARWNKGRNDRLLVKMGRAWLESQQPVPPSAP